MIKLSETTISSVPKSGHKIGSTSPQYDALVRRLQVSGNGWNENEPQVIGVTSVSHGEGVTTVACNVAIAAAKVTDGQVLLVDTNVDRPGIEKSFRIASSQGFVQALCGEQSIFDMIQESRIENLSLMPAGRVAKGRSQPSYVPQRIRDLFEDLKHNYRTIIVDLPPVQPLTTCMSLATCLNGILWVIEADKVQREAVLRTSRRLAETEAKVLGVVYNKVPKRMADLSD